MAKRITNKDIMNKLDEIKLEIKIVIWWTYCGFGAAFTMAGISIPSLPMGIIGIIMMLYGIGSVVKIDKPEKRSYKPRKKRRSFW